MNKFFLIIILMWTPKIFAQATCESTPTTELATQMADISDKQCKANHANDSILDIATGCLSGGGKTVVSTVEGIYELFKFLLIDSKVMMYEQTVEDYKRLMNGDLAPSKIAARAAAMNIDSQEGLWKKAQEYWGLFKKFVVDLKNGLWNGIKGFPCLPLEKQTEYICRGVSEAFLIFLGPGLVIKGAAWATKTAAALGKFIEASKALHGAEELTLARRLDAAADTLRAAKNGNEVRELMTLRNGSIKEITLPNGEKILKYYTKITDKQSGKLVDQAYDISVDANTRAINAKEGIGERILKDLVSAQAGKGAVISIDANSLTKVNQFIGRTQTGDTYLRETAEALKRSLRPSDMLFKHGGDELIVVVDSNDPKIVKAIMDRMINEVDRSPQIRQIFRSEVSAITNRYKDVNKALKYEDMSDAEKLSLSVKERELARTNFQDFKRQKLAELKEAFTRQATYRGSVSVGASMIRNGEGLSAPLSRADNQLAIVKARYKSSYGQDISKYGVDVDIETAISPLRRRGPPIALDPIE